MVDELARSSGKYGWRIWHVVEEEAVEGVNLAIAPMRGRRDYLKWHWRV